ncbi:MAG: 5'-nucleotidase C-terminal domain-containing protein [Anaerolineae bacterium]
MDQIRTRKGLFAVLAVLALCLALVAAVPAAVASPPAAQDLPQFTILHTNDFHGNLQTDSRGRGGAAYLAGKINEVRAEVGAENVALLDAGDEFFGAPPISQLLLGESTIDVFNLIGYQAATLGNHEFDKGQEILRQRISQSNYPWLGANVVLEGTEWDHPDWVRPYTLLTLGSGENQVTLGIIGVDTDETPLVTLKGTTDGLVFKDLTEAILHYYDEVKAQADALIVLAHMGTEDSGPYKGLKTVAQELIAAGKPVDLMIGGHQHEALSAPVWVGDTAIVSAGYAGRYLGRCDVTIDPATKDLTVVNYTLYTITNALTPDPEVEARVAFWAEQVEPFVSRVVGYTNVSLVRNYNAESNMGNLVTDGMLWKADQYDDGEVNGSVDIAFTNPGGLRADITIPAGATLPYTITWGDTFNVMPFGNTLYLMDLTGAQIQALLDQAASLYKGILQTSGATWYWYNNCNCNTPTAWGAYGVKVGGEPLRRDHVYRVVTNNFLAGGQDGWVTFAQGTNRWDTYYDMQEAVNEYIQWYNANVGPIDYQVEGRIVQLDNVVTILHTNDTHGVWEPITYRGRKEGFAYLAALIAKERAHNPNVLLLDAGDTFQGNAFAQYFRNSTPNPIAGGLNLLGYDAFVLGNHEFNFGPQTFATMLGQLEMPILGGVNLDDDGSYGFINDRVQDYINLDVNGLKVTIFGLTNPRVPRYELPTNIPGLTFYSALDTAAALVPTLLAEENPDLLVGLTHIGYQPYGGEVESDLLLAQNVPGIDVLIGGHSHTRLDPAVLVTSDVNPEGTLIAQAERYALYLGKVNVGFKDGQMVLREGYLIPADEVQAPDPTLMTYLQPFLDEIRAYTATPIGRTLTPLDTLNAFTEETNGANLQTDAAVWELERHGIDVDFYLSGAMTNQKVAAGASPANPVTLTVGDMYTLMPYENSLVVFRMNGPQIKRILERAYRNWYYYKYVPGWGGYSHYTTCMLDINGGNQIRYLDTYPELPNGNNVMALRIGDRFVDFNDPDTYYNVGTVNYVAAGSCNFSDEGITIWPLDQIVADTQFYVRDAVIGYIQERGTVNPQVEGRLQMRPFYLDYTFAADKDVVVPPEQQTFTFTATNVGSQPSGPAYIYFDLPQTLDLLTFAANYGDLGWYAGARQLRWWGQVQPGQPLQITFTVNANGASTVRAVADDGTGWVEERVWETKARVTFQHAVAPNAGYLWERDITLDLWNPNTNYWTAFDYDTAFVRQPNIKKMLVYFDRLMDYLPAGAQVTRATLTVTAIGSTNPQGQEVAVAPVLTAWKFDEATWNQAAVGTPWMTPGGDLGDPVDSVWVGAPGAYTLDVTEIVQAWLDGTLPNYGLALFSETQRGAVEWRYLSWVALDATGHPALFVEYTLP